MSANAEDRRRLRFESYIKIIPETGCWEWNAHRYPSGYGQFWWGGNDQGYCPTMKASRAAWRIYRGPIEDGGNVLHKCNNRPCCNPDHLYIGTHKENAEDRDKAGKTYRGSSQTSWKRTPELIAEMSRLLESGMKVKPMLDSLGLGWQLFFRVKGQDPVFAALVKRTKPIRYRKKGDQ